MKALWLILIAFTLGHGHSLAAAPQPAVEPSDTMVTVAAPKATLEIYREGATAPEASSKKQVIAWGDNYSSQTSVPAGLTGVVAIAAGMAHSVALKQDGSVVAWGYNNFGQTSVPARLADVSAVAAGYYHTAALKQDGSVVAWGYNYYGQTSVPSGLTGVVAIAEGDFHTVALQQWGTVVAWGDNELGQTGVPPELAGVAAVAAGGYSTAALKLDGSVVAWGDNSFGQTRVPSELTGVVAIAAGKSHMVALKLDGSVVAWGYNGYGQTSVPAGLTGVVGIAAGWHHTVALKQDGSVVAWGSNDSGQTSVPAGLAGVVAIAAGASHTLALALQNKMDFGSNNLGSYTEHSLSLHSTGAYDIAQLAASISGTDAASFSITSAALPDTLATGSSADLVLRFTPQRLGRHFAMLRILSNDPDMSPYDLTLTGTGTASEIVIESPGSLTAGSTVNMGLAAISAPALTRTFTIRNPGTGSLDGLVISTNGAQADEFALSALGSDSVAAGGSQSFTVSFAPTAAGPRTATLRIASNHPNNNPFDIVLTGQGSGIDIAFAGGARLTRPTQLIGLGTLNTGSQAERSFTIHNTGPQALTGLRVEISGLDAAQFTITPALPGSLAVGEAFTFTVRFSALLGGSARASTLTLLSDAANEVAVSMQFSASVLAARLVIGYGSGVVRETDRGNTVAAWGDFGYSQSSVPAGLTGVIAIAADYMDTVALKQDGSVVAWGDYSQRDVPAGLTGVIAIAAGDSHTVALKQDGNVVAWGDNLQGQTSVPAGLTGVVAIAAGGAHTVALKQDGRVVAWGYNGYGQTRVPAKLTGVVAIGAGVLHTVALKQDGSVVAWGYNGSGQTSVPALLTGVIAVAAGGGHTVALKQDGSVVAWGDNYFGLITTPVGLTGVVAIAAGNFHTVALKQDGSVVAWGDNSGGETSVPAGLTGVVAIAAGEYHSVALVESAGEFTAQLLGQSRSHALTLQSTGPLPLTNLRAVIEGPDADQFRVTGTMPASIALNGTSPFILSFVPTRVGTANATIKIYSNDPGSPFVLPLTGTGKLEIAATKPGVPHSSFTYAPLRLDRATGLMLQKISFANTTRSALNGLRLVLSKVAPGIAVYSSSAGTLPLTLEVLYTNAIAANETISFDLVYSDPKRRTADSINPMIVAESLEAPVPAPGPVTGTLVPLLSTHSTTQGPMLEWNVKPGATYVVEYSDDSGTTWFSAVHRLGTGGTRLFWVDRGQPETQTKPTGTPNQPGGRFYRVKRL